MDMSLYMRSIAALVWDIERFPITRYDLKLFDESRLPLVKLSGVVVPAAHLQLNVFMSSPEILICVWNACHSCNELSTSNMCIATQLSRRIPFPHERQQLGVRSILDCHPKSYHWPREPVCIDHACDQCCTPYTCVGCLLWKGKW